MSTCRRDPVFETQCIWTHNAEWTRKCGNYSDVLPLKAARRDSISNVTSFWASNLSCRRTQCRFIYLWSVTLMPHRGCAMDCWQNEIVRVGKNSGRVLSRLWAKIHEILRQRNRRAFVAYFQTLCPIVYVTFHSVYIRHWVSKSSKNRTDVKGFLPPIFSGGTIPTVLWRIISATYRPPFGKVWLSSVCWSPSAKPGNEGEGRIYRVGKKTSRVLSRLWTKVHDVSGRCRKPLVVVSALDRLSISRFIPKI